MGGARGRGRRGGRGGGRARNWREDKGCLVNLKIFRGALVIFHLISVTSVSKMGF